jgi:flagellar motor switch protein FliN/FliY
MSDELEQDAAVEATAAEVVEEAGQAEQAGQAGPDTPGTPAEVVEQAGPGTPGTTAEVVGQAGPGTPQAQAQAPDEGVYERFAESAEPPGAGGPDSPDGEVDLRRLSDVPMELSVEIGRTRMTVGETLDLRPGSIVTLDRLAGEPVDLLVNGTPIAHGEVVVVDEQFGLRVSAIIDGEGSAERDVDEENVAALGAATEG